MMGDGICFAARLHLFHLIAWQRAQVAIVGPNIMQLEHTKNDRERRRTIVIFCYTGRWIYFRSRWRYPNLFSVVLPSTSC